MPVVHPPRPPHAGAKECPRASAAIPGSTPAPTRRRFLATVSALGAVAAATGVSACAPPPPPPGAAHVDLPRDVSATDRRVRFANWTAYLDHDPATKTYPTLQAFTRTTGIQVDYREDVDDNDTYVNKVAPQLRARQDIGVDLVVFTDWMANRVIREGLCQPLELIHMPHAGNLLDSLKDPSFDPGRQYSLPWQSGFTGIAYNRKKIGRDLNSVDDLWAPDLKGRVVVLSEFRDTAGIIMLHQGVDIEGAFTSTQVETAFAEVDKRITDGHVRRVRGNSYLEDLKSGNAVAGICWSGDIFTLRAETGDDAWQFVMPESGGTLWSDNALVPVTSTHRRNAETLLDHYYRPEVAAKVAAFVNYVCPVQGAQQAMEKIDPQLASSPFIFPGADFIAQHAKVFRALDAAEDAEFGQAWSKVVGN